MRPVQKNQTTSGRAPGPGSTYQLHPTLNALDVYPALRFGLACTNIV
jgi:hypothetical protein